MKTLQLPLYHFIDNDDIDSNSYLHIDRMYVAAVGMYVPYLSVPISTDVSLIDIPYLNEAGRVPYRISLPEPIIPSGDWRELSSLKRRSKMLWWRRLLPECSIKQQYAVAELHQIRGYTSIKAIESGAVMRELRYLCEVIGIHQQYNSI